MIEKVNPVFIGPSEWVCESCRCSKIGQEHQAVVLSNIIDPVYKFYPEKYIKREKTVVLFGCYGGRGNGWKGWNDFVAALKLIPAEMSRQMEVHVFGETGQDEIINKIPVKVLGNISEPERILEIYHQADVFAFPSLQETQGMTKCEALCCGLPVVAFDRTACAEGIEHKVTGWVSPNGDSADFAQGIVYWGEKMKREGATLREMISQTSRKIFDTSAIVRRYIEVVSK